MDERRTDSTPEGSGVIDLQALIALHERAHAPAPAPVQDDEPFVPVVGAERAQSRPMPTVLAGTAFHALLAISTVAFAATLASRPAAPIAAGPELATPAVVAPEAPPVVVALPVPDEDEAALPPEPPIETPRVAASPVARPRATAPAPTSRRAARPAASVAPAPPEAAIDPSLDALLEAALSGTRGAPEITALPVTPPQREVAAILRGLEREVAMCRHGEGGTVATRITVEGATGRVTRVDVGGDAARGTVAACVARTLETARFPRFANEQLVVAFPYRI